MAKKDKQQITQSEGRDNNTRIVKRNWLKISIITFVVVAILVGLSVGMYYIFKPKYSLNSDNYHTNVKLSKISDDITNKKGPDTAILFYSESDTTVNWLNWDTVDGKPKKKSEEIDGPLTEVVNNSDRYWYAINIDDYDNSDLINDLFVDQTEESADFYDGLYGFTESRNFNNSFNYFSNWTYTDPATDPSDAEDIAVKKNLTVDATQDADDDWVYTVKDTDTGTTPVISSSTIMFFDSESGNMENTVSGFTVPADDEENSNYSEARGNLIDWLNYFDSEYIFGTKD